MIYRKVVRHIDSFEYASSNQYGSRYKKKGTVRVPVCELVAQCEEEMVTLICIGSILDLPVRFDWHNKRAKIEIIGRESLKGIL